MFPIWNARTSPGNSSAGRPDTNGIATAPRDGRTREETAWPTAGGCDFLADPAPRATEADVFWHPDELWSVVVLTAASTRPQAPAISLATLPGTLVRREADDGIHILVGKGPAAHQLWLVNPTTDTTPLAALVPLDASALERARSALRVWRFADGDPEAGGPARNQRVIAMLRALDGHLDGASYREIAEILYGPDHLAAHPWKTSPSRATVIRLVRTGLELMRGGYRRLLRPRQRD